MSTAAREFHRKAAEKAPDLVHRQVIQRNMVSYDIAVDKAKGRFRDWQAGRRRAQQIKWEAINNLDKLLEQFEAKILERGGHVFWAADAQEACKYVVDLARRRGVKTVVKSKSMVTEEILLSPALEKEGMQVWETDLGEWIVQLRHEPPYHIVTPAMHLSRQDISRLFREKVDPTIDTDDPQKLVAVARRFLRRAFFAAEMGISGANFLVADAGMVAISTNEGNARLTTSVPPLHVVVTGIEKVIPRLEDLGLFWPLLATSGTGQPITTYSTLIGGPRKAGEVDGPEEFHVVLVDNGRSRLLADPEQREILHCIRCGACLNACPVYRNIGGHTYGTIYPGPIGSVLTPNLAGIEEFHHLPFASSLCGACREVCPVRIDLPLHLLQNRRKVAESGIPGLAEMAGFKVWSWAMMSPQRYNFFGALSRMGMRMVKALGLSGSLLDPMRPWTKYRAALPAPRQSFRELWRKQRVVEKPE